MPQYIGYKLCSLPASAIPDCTLPGADFQIKRVFISDFSHAVNVVFDYIKRGKISVLSGNKEIFFKLGDLFLSLPPVGQVIKMTCKQHCSKEQLTVSGGEGRQTVFMVCHKQ